jgi:phosphoribosylanthranilate isomerase
VIHVKVCGVTRIDDALDAVEAGASAIGLNLIPVSPRYVGVNEARAIADAIGDRAFVVGVVADMSVEAMLTLREAAHLGCLQLHGSEPPASLEALLPHAYKAVRIADAADVELAASYGGDHVLVDAKVSGALGGTGKTFDWTLVQGLARTRKLTLAGGLTPDNVVEAVRAVRPYCVDVASGVEVPGRPGMKDPARVRAFIERARHASGSD